VARRAPDDDGRAWPVPRTRVEELKLSEQTKSISHENALRDRRWVLIDASERPLGRVATRAASVLRGKHRPDFTPHQDAGDFVIIINAGKVRLTGAKLEGKVYSRHRLSGRCAYDHRGAPDGDAARAAARGGGARDATQESARAAAFHQAQDLSRGGSSARRPAAPAGRALDVEL